MFNNEQMELIVATLDQFDVKSVADVEDALDEMLKPLGEYKREFCVEATVDSACDRNYRYRVVVKITYSDGSTKVVKSNETSCRNPGYNEC